MKQEDTLILKQTVFTLLLVLLAVAIRIWPLHIVGTKIIWSTFYPAVFLATLYGGYKQGILSSLLILLLLSVGWRLISPVPYLVSTVDWAGIAPFVLNNTIIIVIVQILINSKQKIQQLNESLTAKNKLVEAMADNLPGTFVFQVVTNDTGVAAFRYISRSVTNFLRSSYEDLIENPKLMYEIFQEDERERIALLIQTALRNKTPLNFDARMKSDEGNIRWINCMAIPQKENTGEPIWDGLFTEITDRKNAEEESRLLGELVKNMADSVSLIGSKNARLLYVNPNFEKLFGYNEGELIGKHVSILNAGKEEDAAKTANDIIASLNTKGYWTGEAINKKKDGSIFWTSSTVSVFEHHLYGTVWVTVQKDITQQKQLAKELEAQQLYNQRLITELFIKDNEKERSRIAKELHEEIGQLLSSSKLYIGFALRSGSHDMNLQQSFSSLQEAIKRIDDLYQSFNAPAVAELGFEESLEILIDKFNRFEKSMYVSLVNKAGLLNTVSPEVKLMIFNCIDQLFECIENNKDRNSASITLQLDVTDGNELNIEIRDTGDASYCQQEAFNYSMKKIQSRVGFFGGSIHNSTTDKGLQVDISVPLG